MGTDLKICNPCPPLSSSFRACWLLDSSVLLKFFRFNLNFIHSTQPPGNFEDLGHFELPLGMRGKHALSTVERRKLVGSADQRHHCGGAPRGHASRGGLPSQVAVSPRYTFKAKAYNFGDQYVAN